MDTGDTADVVMARTCKHCRWLIASAEGRWVHITTTGTIYCNELNEPGRPFDVGEPED